MLTDPDYIGSLRLRSSNADFLDEFADDGTVSKALPREWDIDGLAREEAVIAFVTPTVVTV